MQEINDGETIERKNELRDLFAGWAMQSILTLRPKETPQAWADDAYAVADAMLIARNKK